MNVLLSENSCSAQATVAADGEPDAISVRTWIMTESASKPVAVSIESPLTAEEPVSELIATELTVNGCTRTLS